MSSAALAIPFEERCGLKAHTALMILRNPREIWLIIRIYLFLLLLPLKLRVLKIDNLILRITPARGRPTGTSMTQDRVLYLCRRAFDTLQTLGYRYTCLKRSLLLYHFLRYYGVPACIHFGVRWEGNRLTGHSWLSLNNEVLMEPPGKVEQFTPFFSLPDECRRDGSETVSDEDIRYRLEHCSFD